MPCWCTARITADFLLVPLAYMLGTFPSAVIVARSRGVDRLHFLSLAARAMRQVLVDRARHRGAAKRDGGDRVTLTADIAADPSSMIDLLALDQALTALADVDERKARAIELRVFAGLEFEQIAALLDISRATLAREYRGAQAWLFRALGSATVDRSSR